MRVIRQIVVIIIIRPHRSTKYVDATYCYKRSSVVSVTIMRTAKTAEPIEMPFGVWTRVGSGNRVLDGDPDLSGDGNFEG